MYFLLFYISFSSLACYVSSHATPGADTAAQGKSHHHEHDKSEVFHKDQAQIKEQLTDQVDVSAKQNLTDEEMSFYYFHLHDRDNNTKLDGLEIMQAVHHAHDDEKLAQPTMTEMEDLIDSVLLDHDLNQDGYIDYGEFVRAQSKEDERAKKEHHGDNL